MYNISVTKEMFAAGLPKICVPIVESGLPAIISEIKRLKDLPIDLIEWRMDYFFDDPMNALPAIAGEITGLPLLCTLRSLKEGGKAAGTDEQHADILHEVIKTRLCQLVDIEFSMGEEIVSRLVDAAKQNGVMTVLSKHDFEKTPPRDEIIAVFQAMNGLDADLCKYAVMPNSPRDVLTLLDASLTTSEQIGPIVAISMGKLGKISRVSGSYFGSCMTFATGKESSAPGQMPAEELHAILQDLAL